MGERFPDKSVERRGGTAFPIEDTHLGIAAIITRQESADLSSANRRKRNLAIKDFDKTLSSQQKALPAPPPVGPEGMPERCSPARIASSRVLAWSARGDFDLRGRLQQEQLPDFWHLSVVD